MHIFEDLDQEGLAALEAESFLEVEGMLFRKTAYNAVEINKLIEKGVATTDIQTRINHQSLISYGGSMEQQRKAATRITEAWLKRVTADFSMLYPTVIVETSPQEVLISIRAIAR
jgi:hypothetical protein